MSHKTKTSSVRLAHNSVGFSLDDESSVYVKSVLLDVEDHVHKTNDDCWFSSETDESSTVLPSTPTYSDPSPNHTHDSVSTSLGSAEVGPTNTRFVVIIIASIAFFLQIFSQSIWGAIYEPALLAFPNWTNRSLALLPIWSSVMTAAFVFPACLTINKYGLRVSLLWSCGFFTLGSAVRCLPAMYASTLCLHLSALCLSAGGVMMTPLMITMSAQWFPKNERNMATGFGSTVGMLGSAATYVIGPRILSADSGEQPDPLTTRSQIMDMLSRSERVRHVFGLRVLPQTHPAGELHVQNVDGLAPQRQAVPIAQRPRHGFRRVVSRAGVRPVQHHLGPVVRAAAVHVLQAARAAGNRRQVRSVHDRAHVRHEPDHQQVRRLHPRLQQGAGAVQPVRVADLPVLADAHVELPRETDHHHAGVRRAGRVPVRLVQPEPVVRDGRRADVPVARELRRRLHDAAEQPVRGLRVRGAVLLSAFRRVLDAHRRVRVLGHGRRFPVAQHGPRQEKAHGPLNVDARKRPRRTHRR